MCVLPPPYGVSTVPPLGVKFINDPGADHGLRSAGRGFANKGRAVAPQNHFLDDYVQGRNGCVWFDRGPGVVVTAGHAQGGASGGT